MSCLDLLAEIAVTSHSCDILVMRDSTGGELLDLGTIRLRRAVKRLERQDYAGAMDELRAALQHMRRAGAHPLEVEHLASIIADAERKAG